MDRAQPVVLPATPVDDVTRLALELMARPGHRLINPERALSYFMARARNVLAMRGERQPVSWGRAVA